MNGLHWVYAGVVSALALVLMGVLLATFLPGPAGASPSILFECGRLVLVLCLIVAFLGAIFTMWKNR